MFISTFTILNSVYAAGPFGPPEPLSRPSGGLHTAFGYWHSQDRLGNGSDYTFTQNRIYSEAGYGTRTWDIYGRIGLADLTIKDAYQTGAPGTAASKSDFQDNWSFFGTLGGKIFYSANDTFGVGSFAQATYSFSDFSDNVSGTFNGTPFTADLKVVNPWDVAFGIAFQARILREARLYAGPYLYYSEAKVSPSARFGGITLTSGDAVLRNNSWIGGFAGIDMPLYKSFRLNVEGQYSERLSVGAAVSLVY